ncbi:MAG: hypothetical protein WC788_04085 [Candidatus Paceibacterota bacterium]|jgi:capsular polysaccharide biosynthesis protein
MEEIGRKEGEEVYLIDYVKVMVKRKKVITTVVLSVVVLATIVSLVMNRVYKIESVIEIGTVSVGAPIESPEQVLQGIKRDVYGAMVREKLDISETDFPKIKTGNTSGTNLISMEINSNRADQAKSVLDELSNLIIAGHQEKTKDAKALLESEIELRKKDIETVGKDVERVKAKIVFLEEERNNLDAKVAALQKVLVYRQDAGSQFALFDTKEKLASKKQEIENTYIEVNSSENNINAINGQINILEKQISDIRMTKVVKGPAVSEKIVSPDIVSNLIIAVIFGLFLGIFLAFVMEWWEKNGKEMKSEK